MRTERKRLISVVYSQSLLLPQLWTCTNTARLSESSFIDVYICLHTLFYWTFIELLSQILIFYKDTGVFHPHEGAVDLFPLSCQPCEIIQMEFRETTWMRLFRWFCIHYVWWWQISFLPLDIFSITKNKVTFGWSHNYWNIPISLSHLSPQRHILRLTKSDPLI